MYACVSLCMHACVSVAARVLAVYSRGHGSDLVVLTCTIRYSITTLTCIARLTLYKVTAMSSTIYNEHRGCYRHVKGDHRKFKINRLILDYVFLNKYTIKMKHTHFFLLI